MKDRVNSLEEELATIRAKLNKSTKELGTLQRVTSHASATIHGSLKVQSTQYVTYHDIMLLNSACGL